MGATPLEERLGTDRIEDTSTASVQAIFRQRSQRMRKVWPIRGHVRIRRSIQVVLIAAVALIVLATGYAIGVGF
jgi:hypothetical protein